MPSRPFPSIHRTAGTKTVLTPKAIPASRRNCGDMSSCACPCTPSGTIVSFFRYISNRRRIRPPTQRLWYRNAPARCISLRCSTRRASLPRWPRLPIRLSPTTLPCAPAKPAGKIGATRQRNGPATRQIFIFGTLGGDARPARIAGCHARQLRDCGSVKLGHYYGIHFRLSSALPVCG